MLGRRFTTLVMAVALVAIGMTVPATSAGAAVPTGAKAFAAQVAAEYGAIALTADDYAVVYRKVPGVKRGYAAVDGAGYRSTIDEYSYELTPTAKAFQARITAIVASHGLKVVKKSTKKNPAVLLTSKKFTCSIAYATFACTTTKAAKKAAKKLKPFLKKYVKAVKVKKYDVTAAHVNYQKSKTKGYRIATVVVDGLPMMSGASALYYKAPGKAWKFVRAGQDVGLCSELEKTRDSRRALVGQYCYRDNHESKVRL